MNLSRLTGKMQLKGLRRRWLTHTVSLVVALSLVAVLAVSMAFAGYYYSTMQADMRYRGSTTADFFRGYVNQSYNEYYQSCIRYAESFEEKDSLELQFWNVQGRSVASSYGPVMAQAQAPSDVTEALDSGAQACFSGWDGSTREHIMAVSTPMVYQNGEVIGVLRYVTSLRLADSQILLMLAVALLCALVFVAAVFLSSSYYIRSILEPVAEITATAKRIEGGSYGAQIQSKYNDEIGELADTINNMSTKISQNEKIQRDFISSLSHELRTPLTVITGWSETLLSAETLDPEETRRGIRIISRESKRLTEMVMELLEFTRIQDGRMTLNIEPCDIRAEFEDTVFMYGSRLQQEGIELNYLDSDGDVPMVPCDAKRMRQVFLNILDNAAKHGGEGKKIDASIDAEDTWVVCRIRDYGPGIPEEELPMVKKKFYKGSSKARGSGIGLAVCDEIVEMHGGVLTLENAEGGGTLVTVKLPITQQ